MVITMQKVYNLLAVMAFAMSGSMMIGGVLFYTRIPSLTKKYISELKLELTETILDLNYVGLLFQKLVNL